MKTYETTIRNSGNEIIPIRYFYDTNIRLWTIHRLDRMGGDQVGNCSHCSNKSQLKFYLNSIANHEEA